MIALIGGTFNGKYVDRNPLTPGSTIAVMIGGRTELYLMRRGGIAEVVDYTDWKFDQAIKTWGVRD